MNNRLLYSVGALSLALSNLPGLWIGTAGAGAENNTGPLTLARESHKPRYDWSAEPRVGLAVKVSELRAEAVTQAPMQRHSYEHACSIQ
ncbi:hypothetical protein BH09PSE5_BH09PSE5_01000 [soil metagenome]